MKAWVWLFAAVSFARTIDLTHAVVVTRPGTLSNAEKTAAVVLIEEVQRRSGVTLARSGTLPGDRPAIVIGAQAGSMAPEGYRLFANETGARAVVEIAGADGRGCLFGVGQLLRRLEWAQGTVSVDAELDITTAPAYKIRGHQLGYRAQANSYDAWKPAQFEQYIRELTYFGVNSIEGIPFHDDRPAPLMPVPRREMNRAIGEICFRYGLDYWAWIPADFDLKDTAKRTDLLNRSEEFFKDTPEFTGVFFPGGDPGQNPPELVLPFLEDMAKRLGPSHPKAKIWVSLQWFTPPQVDAVYRYINEHQPRWFGGLVAGPSSPPIPETRLRLPKEYALRSYPDLTHNKLSQYQVPAWDQAFALTLGREAINPRPAEFAAIHNRQAAYTDGFISYSDGIHDDVNKTIWSALSWDPGRNVRDILVDYARAYFRPDLGEPTADAILALERNWRGPLKDNGAVEGTLREWQTLESKAPELAKNWRWQMCLLRANYDAYVRRRLIYETKLETQANAKLAQAGRLGSEPAMQAATGILDRAVSEPVSPALRDRIVALCEALFQSIGLQTSVEKYNASGEERGAVLDFVDYPLNNRWWLEDEFTKVRAMGSESAKAGRLLVLAQWANPGPGSFYDDVGNVANSPHVVDTKGEPTFWWWDQGKSRARLSWQTTEWPASMVYEGLDPAAHYVVRSSGYGQALLRANGQRVEPSLNNKEMGEFKEFPLPPALVKDRKLVLTWDRPEGEEHLNWRQKSRLAEVWLLKRE